MSTTPETPPEGAAPNDAASDVIAETALEAQLSEIQAELAASNDAYLRAKAEAENIRRDSLQAALAQPEAGGEKVLEGVQATLRQLHAALERHKVIEINPPAGTKFDPHQHQAITMVPVDQEPNTVVTVLQKGYLIAERVLRPALVTVAAPKQ
jgi:molecular chaperone GrpE